MSTCESAGWWEGDALQMRVYVCMYRIQKYKDIEILRLSVMRRCALSLLPTHTHTLTHTHCVSSHGLAGVHRWQHLQRRGEEKGGGVLIELKDGVNVMFVAQITKRCSSLARAQRNYTTSPIIDVHNVPVTNQIRPNAR